MERFFRTLRSPFTGTAITLGIIVAGCLGSIFSREVRRSFPFFWGSGPWSWEAFSFWLTAAMASLAYFCRETAVAEEQRRAQSQTLSQAKEFEKLVRTQPPRNFLTFLSSFYAVADAIVSDLLGRPAAPEAVEQGARHLLRMIAVLAQRFDGDEPGSSYAANIMLARTPADCMNSEHEVTSAMLLFCDDSVAIEKLRAILIVAPELSTTAQDPAANPDASLQVFALGVPMHVRAGGRYKVMPGAPLAFVEGQPDAYENTAALAKWCEDHGDFTRETIAQVDAHFRTSEVKGFLSIPLFRDYSAEEGSRQSPFAVLNVHCNQPGLLGRGEALRHFYNLIYPLQILLVKLLLALERLPSSS